MAELILILRKMGLSKLLKGFTKDPKAADRAAIRIKRGESPYYVLTEENSIDASPRGVALRALKGGYEGETYHGSLSDITEFKPRTHFGTPGAAEEAMTERGISLGSVHGDWLRGADVDWLKEYPYYGRLLPLLRDIEAKTRSLPNSERYSLREQFLDDESDDMFETIYPVSLKSTKGREPGPDADDLAWELFGASSPKSSWPSFLDELDSGIETYPYINQYEAAGSTSYVNMKPNVRGKFAMHNPNWKRMRDLLAGAGTLSLLPGDE